MDDAVNKRSIPLHSVVLIVGPDTQRKDATIADHFQPYEVESCARVAYDIYGDARRIENQEFLVQQVLSRAKVKLSLGERAVINLPHLIPKDRLNAASLGSLTGAPIYYVVTDFQLAAKEASEKQMAQFQKSRAEILRGDGIANVIDLAVDEFEAVNKLPSQDLLLHIMDSGYRGLCVIPDVHGMIESLKQAVDWAKNRGLFIVFLGDVLDYGPSSVDCVYLVYDLVMRGKAIMTIGNHERKIERWLDQQRKLAHDPRSLAGKTQIRLSEANRATTKVIEAMSHRERSRFEGQYAALLAASRHHWVLGENIMFVHGAAEPEMFEIDDMRLHGRLETRALYGEVDPKNATTSDGYPRRLYNWIDRVPSGKIILVGHDIRSTVRPLRVEGEAGGTVYFMDTGSGKGGRLTSADILFKDGELKVQNFAAH
jgi:predicted kinase